MGTAYQDILLGEHDCSPVQSCGPIEVLDYKDQVEDRIARSSRLTSSANVNLATVIRRLVALVRTHLLTRTFMMQLLPIHLQPGKLRALQGRISGTSYLDAVRGFAALIVATHHLEMKVQSPTLTKPLINIVQQGPLMVDIFFIISGFVLSKKVLGLIRQRQSSDDILNSLASSVFRRHMRLFLSCGCGTFLAMLMLYFGLTAPVGDGKVLVSFFAQVTDWAMDFLLLMNPFSDVPGFYVARISKYMGPIWTIPAELRGSMVVFLFCLGCCKMRPMHRQLVCCALILLCYVWCAIYIALFLFGVFLAERTLQRDVSRAHSIPTYGNVQSDKTPTSLTTSMRSKIVTHLVSGLSIFLGILVSCGHAWEHASYGAPPFFEAFRSFIPPWWPSHQTSDVHIWLSCSAALIMYGLASCETYQRPFTWLVPQYIGRLSFGIYITHQPVIQLYGRATFLQFLRDNLGSTTVSGIVHYVSCMFVVLWIAEYFTRVDEYIVALGRWVERQLFTND